MQSDLVSSCCRRLGVQMEDDERVLEFFASAGDLQREEPDAEVWARGRSGGELCPSSTLTLLLLCKAALRDFDIIQTFELTNNLKLPLHFKLETCLPFVVLKPASAPVRPRSSCSPQAEDGPYVLLQPQQRTLVRLCVSLCIVRFRVVHLTVQRFSRLGLNLSGCWTN